MSIDVTLSEFMGSLFLMSDEIPVERLDIPALTEKVRVSKESQLLGLNRLPFRLRRPFGPPCGE